MNTKEKFIPTPEQQAVLDALACAMDDFLRATAPYLKYGVSSVIRMEYIGLTHNASIIKPGASPEMALMQMIADRGAEDVLSELVGKPISVQAAAIPRSEMEGRESYIQIDRIEDGEEG